MDWARAKTILIIVFIGVNMILSYFLLVTSNGSVFTVPQDRIDITMEYLKKHNVNIKAELPRKITNIRPVVVDFKVFKDTELSVFFPQRSYINRINEEISYLLVQGDISIRVTNDKLMQYDNPGIAAVEGDKLELCYTVINSFIQKLGISPKECYIKSYTNEDGYVRVKYGQLYKGYKLSDSFIDITASTEGIRKASVIWFGSVTPVDSSSSVVTHLSALVALHEYISTRPREVADTAQSEDTQGMEAAIPQNDTSLTVYSIELGYYQRVNGLDPILEGIATPVWQIRTDTHEIYVDAYGELVVKYAPLE
ncbi:MAG: hypothetical protein ACOZCL_14755 [Bacillota bacterium]